MPEHIRALIALLALSGLGWIVIQTQIGPWLGKTRGRQFRNLWIVLTITAFVAGNFWIYALIATIVLISRRLTPADALAVYWLLLFVVPAAGTDIPGFGVVNYVFTMTHPRLLSLVLLLPAALVLSRRSDTLRWGGSAPDKLLLAYLVLVGVLQLREANVTSSLRGGFYLVIDVFLPYYVASRALQRTEDFKRAAACFILAATLLGGLAVFETLRHWNLYQAMTMALGLDWGFQGYLAREGLIRASGSVGQAIVLGYVMAVGLGMWLFAHGGPRLSGRSVLPALGMASGLIAALSRGPWVGTAVILLAYVVTGPKAASRTALLALGGVASLALLPLFEFGKKVLSLLPFIGTVEVENVTYRQQLFDNAMVVIQRNLWLGSVDYLQTPEMQRMIQGQGIIDIVNSYVAVALNHGLVGLVLFTSFFGSVVWQLWRCQRRLALADERRTLGRAWLATLLGILVMIATVSGITVIPLVYWSVAGVGLAYVSMVRRETALRRQAHP